MRKTALRSTIITADQVIMARVSAADSPVLDRVLPMLSRAAGLAVTRNKWVRRAGAADHVVSLGPFGVGRGLRHRRGDRAG